LKIPYLVAAALCLGATSATAQMEQTHGAGSEQHVVSADERRVALDAIAAKLPENYVFPEKTAAIVAKFTQLRQTGRYDVADPRLLADRVTEDLRAASGDRHLYLLYDPEHYAAAKKDEAGTAEGDSDFEQRAALHDHHGLTELRILPGNIRYLKLTEFQWVPDVTGTVYDDAMRFLKDGDALIIDIRGNGGGSHGAVRYLVSHFMEGDILELTFLARGKPPEQSRTLEHVPAGRMKGKPLYVLIDGGVGSAAEAFAYDVEQFKLGELIGAKTAGAANNNAFTPIAPGFMLSVPFGRPEHAVNHANWEGVGIPPTIETPPGQALDVAQSVALDRLEKIAGITPAQRVEYAWAKVSVEARLHPAGAKSLRLSSFVGRYGPNEVKLIDGALWLSRNHGAARQLIAMTADGLFAVDGIDVMRVHFDGKVMETTWMGEPDARVFPRN